VTVLVIAVILAVRVLLSPTVPALPQATAGSGEYAMATPDFILTTTPDLEPHRGTVHPTLTATPGPSVMASSPSSRAATAYRDVTVGGDVLAQSRGTSGRDSDGPFDGAHDGPFGKARDGTSLSRMTWTRSVTTTPWPTATPTATPPPPVIVPTATPTPASDRQGPGRLRLWTGAELEVVPASGEWTEGMWQWLMPETTDVAGWHPDTADCGQGVTVIGGHSAWGREGALMPLNSVGADGEVVCYDAGGQAHRFAPVDFLFGDGDDPRGWHPDGWQGATLILYTCRPDFSQQVIVRFREIDL